MKRHRNFLSLPYSLFSCTSDQQCPHPEQSPPGSSCAKLFTQSPRAWGLDADRAAKAQLAPAWSCSAQGSRWAAARAQLFPELLGNLLIGFLTRRCKIIKTVLGTNHLHIFKEISQSRLRFQMVCLKLNLLKKKKKVQTTWDNIHLALFHYLISFSLSPITINCGNFQEPKLTGWVTTGKNIPSLF